METRSDGQSNYPIHQHVITTKKDSKEASPEAKYPIIRAGTTLTNLNQCMNDLDAAQLHHRNHCCSFQKTATYYCKLQ